MTPDDLEFRLQQAQALHGIGLELLRRERARTRTLRAELETTRYDPMCGEPILTKAAYFSLLEDALVTSEPLSVIIFDLDGFKQINETYNHMVGDRAIQAMGGAVTRALHHRGLSPAIAGRFGGDEFGVVVYGNKDDAVSVARAIAEELQRVKDVEHNGTSIPLQLRATYGVASSEEELHPRALFELADNRLVYGKNELGEKGHVLAEHIPDPSRYLRARFIDSFVHYDGDPQTIAPRGTPFKGLRSLIDVTATIAKTDSVEEQTIPTHVRTAFAEIYTALAHERTRSNDPAAYHDVCGRVYDSLTAFDRACAALAPIYHEGRVGVHRTEATSIINIHPLVQYHQNRYGYIARVLDQQLETLQVQVHDAIGRATVQHIDKYA
ncbi:GGDEF domain-containing protein [Candidatus Woesearchaeota archaeon]|nr:GGDEF domain-containing protein [Candidatus Woesearchaeota archaeon]